MDLRIVSPKKTEYKFIISGGEVIGRMDKEKYIARHSFNAVEEKAANQFQTRGKNG